MRTALDAILAKHEPYPAVVMNRRWDILATNSGAARFFGFLLGDQPLPSPANVVRLMFDLGGLRPYVTNWESVAEALVRRVHREAVGGVRDETTTRLLEEVLAYPGVPARWARPDPESALVPVIPVSFEKNERRFSFFSAVTTLGTPQDVTLQELRTECFFPLDAETEREVATLESTDRRTFGRLESIVERRPTLPLVDVLG